MANHWVLKTEPGSYPFDRLVSERRAVWDGVTNALALKHIRSMAKGDQAFIYHTGDEKAIVGLARIASDPFPDPKGDDPKVVVVEVEAGAPLARPVTLAAIKADPAFALGNLFGRLPLSRTPLLKTLASEAKGKAKETA